MFLSPLENFQHREPEPVGFTAPGNVDWSTMTGCLIKSMGRVITVTLGGKDWRFKLLSYDLDKNLHMRGRRDGKQMEGPGTSLFVVGLAEVETITFPGWDRTLKGEKKQ